MQISLISLEENPSREENIKVIRETLLLPDDVPVIAFSAEKGDGKEEVLEIIQKAAETQEA